MVEISNTTKSKIDLKLISEVTEKFLAYYHKKNSEVSIAFVGDLVIRRLNKEYRGKDKVTDVLSFEEGGACSGGEVSYLGEIIIDYQQIKRQAKKYSKNVEEELVFILVHGLLHLMGHDDKKEEERLEMIRLGQEFIDKKIKI